MKKADKKKHMLTKKHQQKKEKHGKKDQNAKLRRKRQIQWDTGLMITNRTLDVVIMFCSVFAFIYFFAGQYGKTIAYVIADAIIIPINNGPQAFHWFHQKVSNFRAKMRNDNM